VSERVGFIGLGIMGSRMAANLAAAGVELTVWNRTRATADEWARKHGATVADTPAALAERSDLVITMVVDGEQVESVLLGRDGVAEAGRAGLLCVDMSTVGSRAARQIGSKLGKHGIRFLDAPVTGSSPKAEAGTLTIMCGGDEGDFERARPVLQAMGELIVYAGPLGHGQAVKVINNTVAAVNTAVAGEALLTAKREGIDLDALVKVLSSGSGGSAMLDLKAGPMREHDYTTLFKLEHLLKDVRLCLEEAKAVGGGMRLAEPVAEVLQEGVDMGLGEDDFGALIEVLERRDGTRL
jgi:3-hydroxyisobutyrate dehydrogenase-like beta-hydroxyacid dehydrogenase